MTLINVQQFATLAHTSRSQVYRMIEQGILVPTENKQLALIDALRLGVKKENKPLLTFAHVTHLSTIYQDIVTRDNIKLKEVINDIHYIFLIFYRHHFDTTNESLTYILQYIVEAVDILIDITSDNLFDKHAIDTEARHYYRRLSIDSAITYTEQTSKTLTIDLESDTLIYPVALIQYLQTLVHFKLKSVTRVDRDTLAVIEAYIQAMRYYINIEMAFNRHPHQETLQKTVTQIIKDIMNIYLLIKI